ncbi:MAG: 3-deoxy-manno-octulosonate cytidylyltransferase [Vicinamibacteria bacterium]
MNIVAIIPARHASTRLPGKPLCDILGKPMIQHVYERAREARSLGRVLVATDDERILAAVRGFGGEAVMTPADCASGTDRVAAAAAGIAADVVVNVQGDEPLLDPRAIDAAVAPVRDDACEMATLSAPLTDLSEMLSPDVVKLVCDARGDALYFSRSPLPFVRLGAATSAADSARAAIDRGVARKHVGLYVYRRDALLRLAALGPSPLEQAEGLEQLRALQAGFRIRVVPVAEAGGIAVDTEDDLRRVRERLRAVPTRG